MDYEKLLAEIAGMLKAQDDKFDRRFDEQQARMDRRFEEQRAEIDMRFDGQQAQTKSHFDVQRTEIVEVIREQGKAIAGYIDERND